MTVAALLVSHNGARWLPLVLDGLAAQTRPADQVVAVDTGSRDRSKSLLIDRLGREAVAEAPPNSTYAAAVRSGMDRLDAATQWVWLLHDDSAPAPSALEALLMAASADPTASVLGPKLREWPSLRRLLEVGVTISGTGRRETGLESGEYDQGQHDQIREVLAVNTAGMLVRVDLLTKLDGFDDSLPVFGSDLDFGWRAARAGHRTLVVPKAVVFHAEASRTGIRAAGASRRATAPRTQERRAALYTLLVNCSPPVLPVQVVRLFLGSLVRALGLLALRAPGDAWAELAAVAAVYSRPDRLARGRTVRARTTTRSPKAVRHLLPAAWLPYRHGLDFVADVGTATAHQIGEVAAGRDDSDSSRSGSLGRAVRRPTAVVLIGLVTLAVVGTRGAIGSGSISGGALLPAPDSAFAWWEVYLGSAAPTGQYLLPLALAGTLLLGSASLLVDLVFLLVVPLAAVGAYRFLRKATAAALPSLWGAVCYGLFPVLSGAVDQGRLGTVVSAIVLPWLAHAALFLSPAHPADRRWRACWRTTLWLALLTAFVPVAYLLCVALGVVVVGTGALVGWGGWRRPGAWAPVVAAVGAVPMLLLPWTAFVLLGKATTTSWFSEAGLPASWLLDGLTSWDVLLGRPGAVSDAPAWISLGVLVAAVVAVVRRDTREKALAPWSVLGVAVVGVALLSGQGTWLGFLLLVVQASAIWAATLAAAGIIADLSRRGTSWRKPVGVAVVLIGLLTPTAGLVWWGATGLDGPLDRRAVDVVPAYMSDAIREDPESGVLLVRGSRTAGYEYDVLRGDGRRLGDDTVAPPSTDLRLLTELVGDLAVSGSASDVEALTRQGVGFLYLPRPADRVLSSNLDSLRGLFPASALQPGSRAWQLEQDPTGEDVPAPLWPARPWLLAGQALALIAALVLAAPTRAVGR